jgi:hypothetical protein
MLTVLSGRGASEIKATVRRTIFKLGSAKLWFQYNLKGG